MAFIYNLTDSWNDVTTTWNGIKLAVTDTGSSSTSKLLNLTISGSSTGSFTVDKSGNLLLSGSVNKITMTAPATGATLTLADNSTFITSGAYSSTFTFTGTTTLTFPTSGTVTALGNTTTGSGSIVLQSSPTLVTPNLGVPSALTLTNATGLPIGGISATGTPSATTYLRGDGSWSTVSGGGGSGTVTSVSQTFTGGLISVSGSPITTSGTLALTVAGTSGGVPYFSSSSTWASTGVLTSGALLIGGGAGAGPSAATTGTGVVTALGVNVGSAGAFVVNGGALGTPSSGTLTNATGLPISTGVSGLGSGVATFLATPSSANLASAVTDETGSGSLVFSTAPTFGTNITVGTASSSTGIVNLKGTTSGTVALSVADAAGSWTMKLPTTAGTNGYYLQTDGLGNTTWAAGGGGGGGSPGGSSSQVQYNNSGAFGGAPGFTFNGTATVSLGVASTTSGNLSIYNSASANAVSIKSGNNSVAWSLTLPTSAGTNGYALTTDGAGNTSWTLIASGLTVGSTAISGGTSGRILYDNAGVLGELTTTGSGSAVLATSPTLVTPLLGTPTSGTLTNCTGLPISTGVSGLGTSVATALGVNVGTAGAFVVNGGALGTPSSGTLTSCTGLPLTTGITGVLPVANGGTNASSAGITAFNNITGYTATGATGTTSTNLVFSTSPTITTPTISGNETYTGTAGRILADFDNTTVNSRRAFQTSTLNAATGIYALPNGTSTGASWQAANNADPTNCSKILIATNASTDVQLVSGINGTGTYLPLSIYTSGGQSAQFSTTKGTLSLGVAGTAAGVLSLAGSTSGSVTLGVPAAAGSTTFTLPGSNGTNGQALTTNGSGVTSWSTVNNQSTTGPTIQLYTSGSGTYTVPAGVKWLHIRIFGGGGSGGGAAATTASQLANAGGAGGGGYVEHLITNPSASYSYAVGAGGAAPAAGNNNGNAGGNTTFGTSLLTANGGGGGTGGGAAPTGSSGIGSGASTGGSASGGNIINIVGGDGFGGLYFANQGLSGNGGGTAMSPFTPGVSNGTTNATNYGAGGAGASNNASQSARAGGTGGNGLIIIEEHYNY